MHIRHPLVVAALAAVLVAPVAPGAAAVKKKPEFAPGEVLVKLKSGSGGTASRIMCPCPYCKEYACPEREHLLGWREAEDELAAIEKSYFCCPACGHALTSDDR